MRLLLACALALAAPLAAQTPAPDWVDSAIAQGVTTKKPLFLRVTPDPPGGFLPSSTGNDYQILLMGPYGRVVSAAAANAKRYLPYTRDSVPVALLAPVLQVVVTTGGPEAMAGTWITTPNARHVVLLPKPPKGQPEPPAIQPLTVEPTEASYTYGSGMVAVTEGVTATFPMDAVPTGNFYVVIVTDGKEARSEVSPKMMRQAR